PVAPELGRRIPQRVLVVQVEVEVLLTQRELIGCALEPALQVVGERGHRRRRRVRRRRDALPQSRGYLPHERQPALVDAQRRFHKHPHRLDQRGSRIVEQPRHVLQPARQRHRALFRGAVAPAQQEVQAPEQVRQPESGVLRLRALALETPQGDPDLVQEGRTVDFSFALVGRGLFEGGCDGFERGEVRSESARAEAPIAVVVGLHSRLRRAHGVQVPSQIEVGPLDLPERRYRHAACLSSRWHSSSERTRSVRFAASNNARHAASSSASYPCVSSQYFTFESPDTGEISIFCSSPNSWAGTELYTRSASQACPFFFALMIAAACTPVPVRNASSPITG